MAGNHTKFYTTKTCDTCNSPFDTYSSTVTTCGFCQHNKDLATARAKKAYYKTLEKRDTVPELLKTSRVQSKVTGNWRRYVYCPNCELLCNDDMFCRYCGQRLKNEPGSEENDD